MTCYDDLSNYNMPLTLERHFEELRENYNQVKELHSLWVMMKKQVEDEMIYSRNVFANYSLHDVSHSRSIIQAIERFLGEERIRRLSATDTFMLLICSYAHDYGMAQTFNRIYNILGSDKFQTFLEEMNKNQQNMEKEDAWAVQNLLNYLNNQKGNCSLKDMYLSIMLVAQMYLRPLHWKGVEDMWENFQGLFQGHVKNRFIKGSEGIVEICQCHGQSMESVFRLALRADGMVGDEFHPQFIAEAVLKSQQMKKCIRYIMKQRNSSFDNEGTVMEGIRREYREFLDDFWELLYKNREVVDNQFQTVKQPASVTDKGRVKSDKADNGPAL